MRRTKPPATDRRKAFGRHVRSLRLSAGLTQMELGVRAGLSVVYISELERGLRSVSLDTILALAKAFRLPVVDLFAWQGPSRTPPERAGPLTSEQEQVELFWRTISDGRKRLGMSQPQLALRIRKPDGNAISTSYMHQLERGMYGLPSDEFVAQLAEVLRLDADLLFYFAGRLPPDLRNQSSEPAVIARGFAELRRLLHA